MRLVKTLGYALALPVLLVLLWWAYTLTTTNFYVPEPGEFATTFVDVWFGDRFFDDVLPSIGRLLVGLALSILVGVVAGLVIGSVRWLRNLLEPVLEFFRAIPPPVLVPVLMLLIGVNDQMKVVVIVLGSVWPVLLNTIEGVRSVDSVMDETARSYGIHGWSRIVHLVIPAASPQMMAGIRQALSIGLILMVISEMFASSSGLGFTIVQFQRSFAIPEMWSGIAVLGLIGVVLAFVFQRVERKVLAWYRGLKEVENAG
ncbi:ABC transporter permease [Kocuria salina]|uniref:ABC transporter permease n=1 Tax=Kocuria salina TaxID=1929416 RepID=UPI00159401C5|nr:ABC transporter permease [Kocuria salina]